MVQLFEVGSQLAVHSGIFEPIGNFDTSDYIEPVLNYCTIGGKVNSIPDNSSSPIVYTNPDLMRKAGLDPQVAPQTYGEILAAATKGAAAGLAAELTAGVLEELGWTGLAVPALRRRRGTLAAQMLFYVAVLPAYRVLMVWVYDRTDSLLVSMLMHARPWLARGLLSWGPDRGKPRQPPPFASIH